MGSNQSVLVTGATGSMGPVLVQRLLASGYRVRALVRKIPPNGLLPCQVELVHGDITDRAAVLKALAGVSVVFHLASKLHVQAPRKEELEEYEQINVDGTRCVTQACESSGVSRLVFFSTISVYGSNHHSELCDESSLLRLNSLYARSKREAEKIVLAAKSPHPGVPLAVVLRVAAIYGRRVKGNYRRLVFALKRGWFIPIGDGRNRRTLIYDQDVARAAVLAAQNPDAAGKVYNVTDGKVYTIREILETICLALGRPAPRAYLPVRLVRLLTGLCEDYAHPLGLFCSVNRALVDKFIEDVAINGKRIQDELGFQPQVSLLDGWSEVIETDSEADRVGV